MTDDNPILAAPQLDRPFLCSASFAQVAFALAKAQGAFPPIPREKSVTVDIRDKETRRVIGSYTYKYAPLETIIDKTRPSLASNELAVIQPPVIVTTADGKLVEVVRTVLIHKTGEWMALDIPMFFAKGQNGAQDYGGSLTYARRYGMQMLLCVASEDDDDGQRMEGSERTGGQAPARRGNAPSMPIASNKTVMPSTDELDDALRRFEQGEPAAAGVVDDETGVVVDEGTGEIISPWGADLSPGQVAMAKQRAAAANLSDAAVIKLCGVITMGNVSQALTKLRDAGQDK